MKNPSLLLALFLLSSSTLCSKEAWEFGEKVYAKTVVKLKVEKAEQDRRPHAILRNIRFEKSESSPPSYIVSGKVTGSNTHFPADKLKIYFSLEPDEIPTLCAMTNLDGEFKFRLWVKVDKRTQNIETNEAHDGYLWVGGHFSNTVDRFSAFENHTVRIPLASLIKAFLKK